MNVNEKATKIDGYDNSIIRPGMRDTDISFRGKEYTKKRAKTIKKALKQLHCLEITATNIYKYQISSTDSELNRELIAAMCNEMTHIQDFQVKLFEHGWRPSPLRFIYWWIGFGLGTIGRMLGTKRILRTGIWVETKAVREYGRLLKDIDWDETTRQVVEKNQADEHGHVERWKALLEVEEAGK